LRQPVKESLSACLKLQSLQTKEQHDRQQAPYQGCQGNGILHNIQNTALDDQTTQDIAELPGSVEV